MAKGKKSDAQDGRTQTWNRKARRALAREIWSENPGLTVVHPDSAGIDVGNTVHYVAVPPGRDTPAVRKFGCFTEDLREMAEWLKSCGIQMVVLQSTGSYWRPLYDVLEAAGLEVFVVNARHTRNLPGRKSDVQESQWLMKLHTYGLLNNSFIPEEQIRELRCYWRQRAEHVQALGTAIQRMQKALTEMNVQLANVISDITGLTGGKILRAIVGGERDGRKLAALRNEHIQASEEEIAKSLQGNWRQESLFVLEQELATYDFYRRKVDECDRQVQRSLGELPTRPPQEGGAEGAGEQGRKEGQRAGKRPRSCKNAPTFDLRSELTRVAGVDLTRIDGVDVMTAQTVISEIGLDMSRFKSEGHLASWLGLCPDNQITGGKVVKKGTRPVVNRAATALRLGAWSLIRSESYLGAQYRRFRARLGAPKAITAMAHKLARLIYRMLKYGQEYVDKGMAAYEAKFRAAQIRNLTARAQELGLQLVETTHQA